MSLPPAAPPALALAVALAAGLAGACTRVKSQPPAPLPQAASPAPAPAMHAKGNDRRAGGPHYTAWPASWDKPSTEGAGAARPNNNAAAEEAAAAAAATGPQARAKLQKVLDDALPTLTSCWGAEKSLSTTIAFEATGAGRAENVRMPGASADAARCVAERLGGLSLPTHSGPVISITIPVSVTQGTQPKAGSPGLAAGAAAPATAEAPPAAPKLFVSP